jgi:uncharacterized protein HemX
MQLFHVKQFTQIYRMAVFLINAIHTPKLFRVEQLLYFAAVAQNRRAKPCHARKLAAAISNWHRNSRKTARQLREGLTRIAAPQ